MKWGKIAGSCLLTILLISTALSMHNQTQGTQSTLEFNININSSEKLEFNVTKIVNTNYIRFLAMILDQQDQARIIWTGTTNLSDSTAPNILNIYLSSHIDNYWKTIKVMDNVSNEIITRICTDQANHLHLAWVGYEDGKKTLFYANNVEGNFKPEPILERTPYIGTMLTDAHGSPHLVGSTKEDVFYATRNQSWNIIWLPTINQLGFKYPHLRLDSDEHPHIVWIDKTEWDGPFQLMYATEIDGKWNIEQVTEEAWPPGPRPFEEISLDLDMNDQMHITWESKRQCIEAVRSNGNWTFTKGPINTIGQPCCLTLDQMDIPCVKAWVDEARTLWYVTIQGETWYREKVAIEVGPKTGYNALTVKLDSKNEPHFAWRDDNGIFYAKRGLGAPIIDSPSDFIHIKGQPKKLIWHPFDANPSHYYVSRNGTLIEEDKWSGGLIAINLDKLDVGVYQFVLTVVDIYKLSAQDSVLVTVVEKPPIPLTGIPNGWEVMRITANNQIDNRLSMALDSVGQLHILWHGPLSPSSPTYMDSNMYYGRFENGSWIANCLTSAYGWGPAAIAIDANDAIHTIYSPPTIEGPLSVRYGKGTTIGAFHTIIPEKSILLSVRSMKIITDAESNPHIVVLFAGFLPPSNINLGKIFEYGTIVNGSWQFETLWIDTKYAISATPSIVVDSKSQPHIVWYADDGIYYATRTLDMWKTQLITNITISSSPSLAIDSANFPHIAWEGDGRLYYMKKVVDAWETTQIPTQSEQNRAPSLSLDSKDQPHLAWSGMGVTNYEIFYATKELGAWKLTQLTDNSVPDHNPLLLLDNEDLPHIAWVLGENENQEIMYATLQDILTSDKPHFISLTIFSSIFALIAGFLLRKKKKLIRMNES